MKPLRLLVCAALSAAVVVLPGTGPRAHADGWTRVTSYFCPPNCGAAAWSGTRPIAGFTAACARAHAGQYVHLVYAGITARCDDYGASWYFERGDEPVDVFGVYLGEDWDFVTYSYTDGWY